MVAVAWRDGEAVLGDAAGAGLVLRRFLGEDEADRGAVGLLLAVGRVVHLKDEEAAFRNLLGHARGEGHRQVAGGVGRQETVADAVGAVLLPLAGLAHVND